MLKVLAALTIALAPMALGGAELTNRVLKVECNKATGSCTIGRDDLARLGEINAELAAEVVRLKNLCPERRT